MHNRLSADHTEQVVTALLDSPSIGSLTTVNLDNSLDLSKEESCVALANFVAEAINLTYIDIDGHRGRKIKIEVRCKNEETGEPGCVKLTDKSNNNAVIERPTDRVKPCEVEY